jgi:hypothetical protein
VICGSAVCAWINEYAPMSATAIAVNTRPMHRN